ncbi:MAG: YkvA family protein [Pseudohaliea sp.]
MAVTDRALVETGFWAKLGNHATAAGREVVEKALWLYYAARAPQTPAWARSVIYGALAYLVLPADAIPDALPAIGFSDDLATLTAAVATVALFIDDAVKEKAAARLAGWFGPYRSTDEAH